MSQQQRIILISGANKGIGWEVIKLLAVKFPQDIVVLGTRDLKNGEQDINQIGKKDHINTSNVKLIQLDVTNAESIKAAVNKIESEYGRLDVLINNSGVLVFDDSRETAEPLLDVNVSGVERMNDVFLQLLSKSASLSKSKPINIVVGSECGAWFSQKCEDKKLTKLIMPPDQWTSSTVTTLVNDFLASFDDNTSTTYSWQAADIARVYCASKALVGGYSRWFAREHPELDVAIVTPGYCASDLTQFKGTRKASVGAESVVWHIDNKFESGQFYRDGKVLPWAFSPEEHADW